MTNLAVQPPATLDEEASEFTQMMRVAFHSQQKAYQEHQELKRLYALALAEIEQLRAQVSRYQRGEGIIVKISGKDFSLQGQQTTPSWSSSELLSDDLRAEVSAKLANWTPPKPDISESFLNDQPPPGDNGLKDSYMG